MFALFAVVCVLLHRRLADPEDGGAGDAHAESGLLRRTLGGLLLGLCAVGLLAGAYSGARRLGIPEWIYGPDCQRVVYDLGTLQRNEAFKGVIEDADQALTQPWGAGCQHQLREWKVWGLLGRTKQVRADERLGLLEQAWQEVQPLDDAKLIALVDSRLHAERARGQAEAHLAQARRERQQAQAELAQAREARQQAELARHQAEAKLAQAQQAIDHLERLNAELNAELLATLRDHRLDVEETERGIKIVLSEKDALRFAPGRAELNESARDSLRFIAIELQRPQFRRRHIEIVGHTDATGNNHLPLSRRRALSVASALEQLGVDKARLVVVGKGDQEALASNETAAGRAKNRRVEIIVQKG
jgi:flagellar motor protein MotB